MPRHLAEPETETQQETLDRLARNVARSLQEYLAAYRHDLTQPTILEWAACIEYATPEHERGRTAARLTVCQGDQISLSAIQGLGLAMAGLTR